MEYTRCVGIELELEGVNPDDLPDLIYWRKEEEGSLRGDNVELVLARPVLFTSLYEPLEELSTILEEYSFFVSSRCSLHVHIDARGLTNEQLFVTCLIYTLFERSLYELSGRRNRNKYCVPVYLSSRLQKIIAKVLKYRDVCCESERYGGINLASLSKFGSIEFRMHEGTLSIGEITSWVTLLHSLVSNAIQIDLASLMLYLSSYSGVNELKDIIFKDNANRIGTVGEYTIKMIEHMYILATGDI